MTKLFARLWRWPTSIYLGIGITGIGFILLAFTWVKVAKLTSVVLQLPYFISGGLTAVALIMIGLAIVSLAARAKDEAEHRQKLDRISEILSAIKSHFEESEE